MDFVKKSVTLNNEGVSLLAAGDNSKATSVFQRSLSLMKQGVHAFDTEEYEENRTASFAPLRRSSVKLSILENGCCFVYSHGLLLNEDDVKDGEDTDNILLLFSSIILVNFALACHQQGLVTGKAASLKKASQLYKMALDLLIDSEADDVNTISLALISLNNRAQIHYDFCDYDTARNCIEEMGHFMVDIQYLQYNFTETDVEGILLNMMLLDQPTAAHAA